MNKEFIPYEQALALKELGFDEEIIAWYDEQEDIHVGCSVHRFYSSKDNFGNLNYRLHTYAAPLYQQAFRWFFKKHNLYAVIIPTITMHWTFKTMTVTQELVEVPPYNHVEATDYSIYEETEQACLEKLIEIVKNKQD